MQIPSFYISIIAEATGLSLLIFLVYLFLLKRDKNNLTGYIFFLKEKVKGLQTKLKDLSDYENPVKDLLVDTIEHIKKVYSQNYGHDIGKLDTTTNEDNSKEHFVTILGHQSLKAILAAFDNSNTPEHTWEKISAQLSALIENYRVMPETQFETLLKSEVQKQCEEKQLKSPETKANQDNKTKKIDKDKSDKQTSNSGQDQFITDRKNEIERLKSQISSQFEDIWKLQNQLSSKASQSTDKEVLSLGEGIEAIGRQLKDAELCMSMMEADIATSDEEIITLKEQLEEANIRASAKPMGSSELTEEIKKKDAKIARFAQESKEMLSLIDGMEAHASEQSAMIKELRG